MRRTHKFRNRGFTLIELMVSMAVFLIIAGAIFSSMMKVQQDRRKTEIRSDLEDKVRAAAELIVHDIAQAGRMPRMDLPLNSLTGTAAANSTTITVVTGSTSWLYSHELISVDFGSKQEYATVVSFTPTSIVVTIANPAYVGGVLTSTPLAFAHNTTAVGIYPAGILAEGIIAPDRTAGFLRLNPPVTTIPNTVPPTSAQLFLMGAIDNDTTLELILYQCPAPNAFPGPLTRYVYTIAPGSLSSASSLTSTVVLLNKVTACLFTYPATAFEVTKTAADGAALSVVPYITFSISAQSDTNEPGTNAPWNLNKSYMYIQPRNLTAVQNSQAQVQVSPNSTTILSNSYLP